MAQEIVTNNGGVAFANDQLPGMNGKPATDKQVEAHTAQMNKRAEALGIKTRYEIKEVN